MERLILAVAFILGSLLAVYAWNDLQYMHLGWDRNYFPTLMFAVWATVSAVAAGVGLGLTFRR